MGTTHVRRPPEPTPLPKAAGSSDLETTAHSEEEAVDSAINERKALRAQKAKWRAAYQADLEALRLDPTLLNAVNLVRNLSNNEHERPVSVSAELARTLFPDGMDLSAEECLGQIASRALLIDQLRNEMAELVDAARDTGATWTEVGLAAGIGPSSAYQRWSERGRENHRVHQRKHAGREPEDIASAEPT